MFNQISFADKLLVEELLEKENESNGERTSHIGWYRKFISHLTLILENSELK